MNKWVTILFACLVSGTPSSNAQDSGTVTNYETKDFDKLANKTKDHALVNKIRNQLLSDKLLSKEAKNVKIIVVDNEIILKGPVISSGEKSRIINLTSKISKTHSIRNQLEVKRVNY